jgi:hypothetical protein
MDALNNYDRFTPQLKAVADERARQDEKWGPVQDHPDIIPGMKNYHYGIPTADAAKRTTDMRAKYGSLSYTDILVEEVCEAIEEASNGDRAALRTELIQVAAVAVKWVENLDAAEGPVEILLATTPRGES